MKTKHENKIKMSFGEALIVLHSRKRAGYDVAITRAGWYGTDAEPKVKLQEPDEHSFMTEPYYYMEKYRADGKVIRFPFTPSPESTNACDWVLLDDSDFMRQVQMDIDRHRLAVMGGGLPEIKYGPAKPEDLKNPIIDDAMMTNDDEVDKDCADQRRFTIACEDAIEKGVNRCIDELRKS